MTTYSYINSMPYSIGEEKVQIVNINLPHRKRPTASSSPRSSKCNGRSQAKEVTSEGTGTAHLPEIDDEQSGDVIVPEQELAPPYPFLPLGREDGRHLSRSPMSGRRGDCRVPPAGNMALRMHVLNLYYPLLDMAEKMLHTFEVWILWAPAPL